MENRRGRAHDIAEEGLDKIVEGDKEAGQKLIDDAEKIDPKAVEELAEEIERDWENAERFVEEKWSAEGTVHTSQGRDPPGFSGRCG